MFIEFNEQQLKYCRLIFDITENIMVIMESKNITKEELALRLQMSLQRIEEIFSGIEEISISDLFSICEELGIDLKITVGER